MIDIHVHIGRFFGMYIDADMLSSLMKRVGVDKYAVSSTTICAHDYAMVLDELHRLIDLDPTKVLPTLWITSCMLADDKEAMFIDSGIDWRLIKIHPGLEERFWQHETAVMDYVVAIAHDLQVPILIHTGDDDGSNAASFAGILERHPEQVFILAHGRPLAETIEMLKRYSNTYVDTAFMPTNDVLMLSSEGLCDRVLWGSDSCIINYTYPEIDLAAEYNNRIRELHNALSSDDSTRIFEENAKHLFKL